MSLYPLLQEYLVETGHLPISTIGQLNMNHTPAQLQENEKTLIAPINQISYSPIVPLEADTQKLLSFLSNRLLLSQQEAELLLIQEDLPSTLLNGKSSEVNWEGLGLLQNVDGTIQFVQDPKINQYLPALVIEKIRRQLVSEPVINTFQQSEIVPDDIVFENEEPIVKDYWWVWALVIFILSVILIFFQFV